MNNNFDFIRKILYSDSSEVILQGFKSLSNEGLEVYVQDLENGFRIADEQDVFIVNTLFVPAADWKHAVACLENNGLSEFITECEVPNQVKSDLDIAREQFFKKRKWTYIETAVIIVLAMIYFLFKTIF